MPTINTHEVGATYAREHCHYRKLAKYVSLGPKTLKGWVRRNRHFGTLCYRTKCVSNSYLILPRNFTGKNSGTQGARRSHHVRVNVRGPINMAENGPCEHKLPNYFPLPLATSSLIADFTFRVTTYLFYSDINLLCVINLQLRYFQVFHDSCMARAEIT